MNKNNAEKIELLQHAAALLDAEALAVREGHTLDHTNPDWTGEEEAKAAHDDIKNTSTRLYALANDLSQPAQSAVVPEGWKLVPISASSRIIVAIESAIDSQLTASGMSPADMFRQDGQSIWDAAIATAPSARLAVDRSVAPQPYITDAYNGAREDMSIWKRRALEAERDLRTEKETTSRLCQELNEQNGPTFMGEPAQAQVVAEGWQFVPKEPDETMDAAARAECHRLGGVIDPVIHIWDVMLEQAAKLPLPSVVRASPVLTQPSEQEQAGDKYWKRTCAYKGFVIVGPSFQDVLVVGGDEKLADDIAKVLNALSASQQASERDKEDAALLDWLQQNFYHRQMDEWDSRSRSNTLMWCFFAPEGVQSDIRKALKAARAAQEKA